MNDITCIEFTPEEMSVIIKYMELAEAISPKVAILNAISLVLDMEGWNEFD